MSRRRNAFSMHSLVPFLGYIVSVEGMRMDPDRVQAVVDWPTPDSRKALQRFLGFANFYRRFIRSFSQLAAPLTALTSIKTPFRWSSAAEAAFTKLKGCFVSAPILIAPDPSRQFVVEVDASEVGVGAVLSQRSSSDDKVHPCAYFSHRLSPAERNYDIGNRELLAVKLALEEWRHWLEGSGVPFIVWTDHKNLEYIKSAKRLNSSRPGGLYFSVVSIFLFLIGQVPRTSSPMHCPVFSTILIARLFPSPLCHRRFLFLRSLGRLSRRSARPRKG